MTGIGGGSIMAPLIGQLKSVKAHQNCALYQCNDVYWWIRQPLWLSFKKLDLSLWLANRLCQFLIVIIVVLSAFVTGFFLNENSR